MPARRDVTVSSISASNPTPGFREQLDQQPSEPDRFGGQIVPGHDSPDEASLPSLNTR
jgi:hypothetical protein